VLDLELDGTREQPAQVSIAVAELLLDVPGGIPEDLDRGLQGIDDVLDLRADGVLRCGGHGA
jgi:hypothetical protein